MPFETGEHFLRLLFLRPRIIFPDVGGFLRVHGFDDLVDDTLRVGVRRPLLCRRAVLGLSPGLFLPCLERVACPLILPRGLTLILLFVVGVKVFQAWSVESAPPHPHTPRMTGQVQREVACL